MTPFREHRTHSRMQCRVPLKVVFQARRGRTTHEAVLYNVSEEGVYLETDHEFKPGDRVDVHPVQRVPRVLQSIHLGELPGTIQWSRSSHAGRHRVYCAGVRFEPARAAREEAAEPPGFVYLCDLCGEAITTRFPGTAEPVWLCPECRRHLEGFPEPIVRITVRHLIGNVL